MLLGYVGLKELLKALGKLQSVNISIVRIAGAFLGSCVKVLVGSLFISMDTGTLLLAMLIEGAVWAIIVAVFLTFVAGLEKILEKKK